MVWIMGWPSFPLIFSSNHTEYWGETDAEMHSSQFERVGLTHTRHILSALQVESTPDMVDAAPRSISIVK